MIYLKTSRVLLRHFESTDRTYIEELNSDPDVMLYLTDGRPSNPKEIDGSLADFLRAQRKHDGKLGYFVAIEKKSYDFIGWFHLRPTKAEPDNTEKLELGFRLKKDFWGQELATEVSQVLIKKAFDELGASEVCARTMKSNIASIKVMENCGMVIDREEEYEEFPGEDKASLWLKITKEAYSA